jgi:hypothetical protein
MNTPVEPGLFDVDRVVRGGIRSELPKFEGFRYLK